MARGVLTEKVKEISKERLGYEISVRELRLLPYIMHCLLDNIGLDRAKLYPEEKDILKKWQEENLMIAIPYSDLSVTPKFYDDICEILKVGYCEEMIKSEVQK